MSLVSERQTGFTSGGNFATLKDFVDRKEVVDATWASAQAVAVSGANFALLPSTILAGNIAKGSLTSQVNGQILAGELVGAVGTGAITTTSDSLGNILNLVDIRKSSSNEEIVDTDERKVWGLIQCSNGVADGAAIGGAGSENLQISFVKFDSTDSLALVSLSGTIEFHVTKIYAQRFYPAIVKRDGLAGKEVKDLATINKLERVYEVATSASASGMQVNLNTDSLTGSGGATVTVDSNQSTTLGASPLPVSGAEFAKNEKIQVFRNGVRLDKGISAGVGEVGYVNTNTIQLNFVLDIGERIYVTVPSGY
jgi:hypothetical protein